MSSAIIKEDGTVVIRSSVEGQVPSIPESPCGQLSNELPEIPPQPLVEGE